MPKHTHYIYEVVMTEGQREDDVPDGFVEDNGGLEHFEASAITHTHELFDVPDEPPHSHMADPVQTGTYIEADQPS